MTGTRMEKGGLIDRAAPRRFFFDGRAYEGFAGDTLASALLASGVRVMGRSFKYHRPRGVWGAWVDDPNAFMDVSHAHRHFSNCQAASTYLEHRMEARAVNAWPNARWDIKGGLDLFHRWLGAGFYYKTFMWPHWHLYEPIIRRMAGMGRVHPQVLEDYLSDQVQSRCDLLVIGGGPAGLTVAREAAEAGRDVLIVDDHDCLGGSAYRGGTIDGMPASDWVRSFKAAIEAAGGRIMTRTTAFGVYDHGLVALSQDPGFGQAPRLWQMRPDRVVLATGALDRPVTFTSNDRPGVMSIEAGAEYLARYGVLVGKTLCVLSTHPGVDPALGTLEAAGAKITRVDPAAGSVRAVGRRNLRGLKQGKRIIFGDVVLTSAGPAPLVHLWRHAGGKLDWRDDLQAFVPGAGPETMQVTGAAMGLFKPEIALEDARAVALEKPRPGDRTSYEVMALPTDQEKPGRQWIDFQHDVTLKDVIQAVDENYASVEHLKRYTTLGMAADQGKTANIAGLTALASLQGKQVAQVGSTTFRPPFVPQPMTLYRGAHSGQDYHPLKRLPLERAHRSAGAAMAEYGGWLRPAWYGGADQTRHIRDEITTARERVGLFDASPLGKIEVVGPDAEAFLNFIYYNTISGMQIGTIRYGFMLTEGGVIFDDGVLARLGPAHFLVSCSSGHAEAVDRMLQTWRQDGHDPDRIFIHHATAQWATLTVTGPEARGAVAACGLGIDLYGEDFPHMHLREGQFAGQPARVARVSFTGDPSYEISVPALAAQDLWECLENSVRAQMGTLLGLEALSVMRAEKGYVIAGRDTDGLSMPHDLGFSGPRLRKQAPSVGNRSLRTDAANDPSRRQLVGLRVPEGEAKLPTGAHVITATPKRSIGIVTSSYDSPTLGHPIALGLVEGGTARHGETVRLYHLGAVTSAQICAPCFLDPEGERLNA